MVLGSTGIHPLKLFLFSIILLKNLGNLGLIIIIISIQLIIKLDDLINYF